MSTPSDYTNNVFINCPFDPSYKPCFEAIVFAIHDCGFIPRCAREEDNAGDVRILKIMKIIDECKYGIHDISKADLDSNTKLARFNMPLELGIFLGAHKYSSPHHYNKDKRTLIMDLEPYRYREFISDLGGQDVTGHHGNPEEMILNIRNFLITNSRRVTIASGEFIFGRYSQFIQELPQICDTLNWDRNNLTFIELSTCIAQWILNDSKEE